jgi:hypothetical protein
VISSDQTCKLIKMRKPSLRLQILKRFSSILFMLFKVFGEFFFVPIMTTMNPNWLSTARFTSRLLRSSATATIALSTLAGGILLANSAKANVCTFAGGGNNSINNCLQGVPYVDWHETDKHTGLPIQLPVTPTDKQILFKQGPTAGAGTIDWVWFDMNNSGTWKIPPDPHSIDEWHVEVDFTQPLIGVVSTLKYDIRITEPMMFFEDVTLGANTVSGVMKKYIYDSEGGTLLATLTNGQTWTPTVLYNYFHIVDEADATTGPIEGYQNIYRQVPGPLPILGASAAFGFSRRLRSRVKASRAA